MGARARIHIKSNRNNAHLFTMYEYIEREKNNSMSANTKRSLFRKIDDRHHSLSSLSPLFAFYSLLCMYVYALNSSHLFVVVVEQAS